MSSASASSPTVARIFARSASSIPPSALAVLLASLVEQSIAKLLIAGIILVAFALLGDSIVRASPKFRALQEAHQALFEAYRHQRWAEARAVIAQARKLNGAIETLYDLYEQRIAHFEANPPGLAWNGVWYAGRI